MGVMRTFQLGMGIGLIAAVVTGCGNSPDGPKLIPVKGKITLNGRP